MKHCMQALLVLACVSGTSQAWEPVKVGRPTRLSAARIEMRLPPGWLTQGDSLYVLASRDGPPLELIEIRLLVPAEAAKLLKQPFHEDMDPQDLSEAYARALVSGDGEHEEVRIDSNEPTTLAGRAGFRVHLHYRAAQGSSAYPPLMEQLVYAAATHEGLLLASLEAPQLHYFSSCVTAFEAVVGSIKPR